MVIYSFLLYTFCRLPELFLYMYLIIVDEASNFFYTCFGPVAVNVVEYVYVVSYSFNLLFFAKFNKNFREALKNQLKRIKQ